MNSEDIGAHVESAKRQLRALNRAAPYIDVEGWRARFKISELERKAEMSAPATVGDIRELISMLLHVEGQLSNIERKVERLEACARK